MKNILLPLILALLLLAAGSVCWTLGIAQERLARQKQQVATMDFNAVTNDAAPLDESLIYAARVPVVGGDLTNDARDDRATANYWLTRYDALGLQRDAADALVEHEPRLLLLAANAAYRASRMDPADRAASARRMQVIVKNYADVLKSSPGSDTFADAAYNYEFASRTKATLDRPRPSASPAANVKQNPPSIHGRPGSRPKAEAPNPINVIVPKRGDERNDSPEAGKGGQKIRKG